MKRVDVVCALIFDDAKQQILLVKNKSGDSAYWSIPGGAVEAGETLEEAVKRETKEETGFDIDITGLFSVREVFFTERGHHAVLFTFHAEIIGGEMKVSDPDHEIEEVRWMDLQTANDLMTYLPDHVKYKSSNDGSAFYYFHGKV